MADIKTLVEVENIIELIEHYLDEQDRYRYSNDVLVSRMFDQGYYKELENELKYYNRIANKYLNKLIRGRV